MTYPPGRTLPLHGKAGRIICAPGSLALWRVEFRRRFSTQLRVFQAALKGHLGFDTERRPHWGYPRSATERDVLG